MAEPTNEGPGFSVSDVLQHVEVYGVDLFPVLDLSMETMRAQSLFSQLRDRWPHLYQSVTMGTGEFVVTATFDFGGGKKVLAPTFSINNRGPIFTFPRRLPVTRDDIDMGGEEPSDVFEQALEDLFLKAFAPRKALRLGVVRQLVLGTGQTDCTPWLGSRVLEFDSARLTGAQCLLVYQDDIYNYRIQMEPMRVLTQSPVPATGQVMTTPDQFGLGVSLDVNNRDAHPLDPEEIRQVITRAKELWPDGLMNFLNHRRLP